MIKDIRIQNYKSIQRLKMNIGRLNVLIGENGSGKTNVLESIALASAASINKLDNEFLSSRGIRVTEPKFMRSAFDNENIDKDIHISFTGDEDVSFSCRLQNDNKPYSKWKVEYGDFDLSKSNIDVEKLIASDSKLIQDLIGSINSNEELINRVAEITQEFKDGRILPERLKNALENAIGYSLNKKNIIEKLNLQDFLVYSPENFSLRVFEKEGQIEPLGINGEGLFKLLKVLSMENNASKLKILKKKLRFIDWFKDFEMPEKLSENEKYIRIKDKYLTEELSCFDQKSSNEGFLFLLFYFSLFISENTPDFFAIDNIDASLNPKLCSHMTKELVSLGKKYHKQAILTTHNPAVLDGLNLDDPDQKLFVVYRNKLGYTKIKQILKPKPLEGQEPVKLSEAFLRGYIGGLPKGF